VAETEEKWEYPSLEWIHRVREARYQKTKDLSLESWLKATDPQQAIRACRRLGLKVRLRQPETRERETTPR
jgi:hypothetical protein